MKPLDESLSEKYTNEIWGPRCADFDPDCATCRAWRMHDFIFHDGPPCEPAVPVKQVAEPSPSEPPVELVDRAMAMAEKRLAKPPANFERDVDRLAQQVGMRYRLDPAYVAEPSPSVEAVAWLSGDHSETHIGAKRPWGWEDAIPLYTHPAPSVVEALKEAQAYLQYEATNETGRNEARNALAKIDAALQAKGEGL